MGGFGRHDCVCAGGLERDGLGGDVDVGRGSKMFGVHFLEQDV